MRKVKHLTITLTPTTEGTSNSAQPIKWALVYVPAGTTPTPLNDTGSLYEPNQFVMNCGVADGNAGPIRIFSRLSRNLNSGDGIALILRRTPGATGASAPYLSIVSYAITLQ